mmetsp:Transcript_87339/g.154839  ORF Transcript_87339/g.154839 Transcript_87339/m.154839 type:complete len:690 (-) Transcript_87339:106-2175(-)|eukprot:CAMPEP_0197658086 /NCGR_PEP_ID=MMETSP1338-20131121/45020_1 /TAXON_ID=43686 ORGANISM="Pelagodinium beii, Strain RCC1491" /NCGR_SAMPLE_ID=MMETSP1338 /ASSEMBLY_ACC=CAM_ASM_000754 /LENGTH=689 /DNA_ID=CAMNT_0043234595 /DNA_START=66 /DNA_END=2135 /DNA_ORIENTATION=+
MKFRLSSAALWLCTIFVLPGIAGAAESLAAPVQKALTLLEDLKAEIVAEGKEATELFREETELCKTRAGELAYAIKQAKKKVDELQAVIQKETARIEAFGEESLKLNDGIAENQDELEKAIKVRANESAAFAATEKELAATVDAISRASGIIEREMSKGASLAQLGGASDITAALDTMVQAFAVKTADVSRLSSLLQESTAKRSQDEDFSWNFQPPEAAAYKSSSKGLLEALEGLRKDAQDELYEARKEETEALNNFKLKKQSLEDEIRFMTGDLDKVKAKLTESQKIKAVAEGDLQQTQADMEEDVKAEKELKKSCMEEASDYQAETKGRAEEVEALSSAQQAIKDKLAASLLEESPSFLQVKAQARLAPGNQVLHLVRSLGLKADSVLLTQLASRMESTLRLSSKSGEDVFEKIRGMITEMIARLEKEAKEEATKKAYCDREMQQGKEKQDDSQNMFNKLSGKVEQRVSRVAKLQDEIKTHHQELVDVATSQAEMDKIRREERAFFEKEQPKVKAGLEGVKLAIKVLRDFYSGKKANGKGGAGIIAMLEVAESDFSKNLAEMVTEEERAKKEHQQLTHENEVVKATTEQDIKYKSKEVSELKQELNELNSDLTAEKEELEAMKEFMAELEKQCVAKPEAYEMRVQKRQAEMDGLKEALKSLEAPPSFLQAKKDFRSKGLRGVLRTVV